MREDSTSDDDDNAVRRGWKHSVCAMPVYSGGDAAVIVRKAREGKSETSGKCDGDDWSVFLFPYRKEAKLWLAVSWRRATFVLETIDRVGRMEEYGMQAFQYCVQLDDFRPFVKRPSACIVRQLMETVCHDSPLSSSLRYLVAWYGQLLFELATGVAVGRYGSIDGGEAGKLVRLLRRTWSLLPCGEKRRSSYFTLLRYWSYLQIFGWQCMYVKLIISANISSTATLRRLKCCLGAIGERKNDCVLFIQYSPGETSFWRLLTAMRRRLTRLVCGWLYGETAGGWRRRLRIRWAAAALQRICQYGRRSSVCYLANRMTGGSLTRHRQRTVTGTRHSAWRDSLTAQYWKFAVTGEGGNKRYSWCFCAVVVVEVKPGNRETWPEDAVFQQAWRDALEEYIRAACRENDVCADATAVMAWWYLDGGIPSRRLTAVFQSRLMVTPLLMSVVALRWYRLTVFDAVCSILTSSLEADIVTWWHHDA